MNAGDIPDRLWEASRQALTRSQRARAERESRGAEPRPGDVLLFAATAEPGVLWVVVEADPEADRYRLVAADGHLLVGSADVAVAAGAACGALSVRCAVEVELAARDLAAGRPAGVLDLEVLDRVRGKRAAIAAGESVGSWLERETDAEVEYRDWMADVGQAAALLARAPAGRILEFRPPVRRGVLGSPWAIAATVLLAVSLGLAAGVAWERGRQRPPSPEAVLNLPFVDLYPMALRGAARLEVPSTAPLVHLILALDDPRPYPEYRLELRERREGTLTWSSRDLERIGTRVSVALPRALFGTGEYELRLYGLRDAESVELGEYALEIAIDDSQSP